MSDDQPDAWRSFLESLPAATREVAERYPAHDGNTHICYRSTENPRYHYIIYSYFNDLTVTLVHGADSTLPGVGTFGQPYAQLRHCGCGRWRHASAEQAQQTKRRMDVRARRGQT